MPPVLCGGSLPCAAVVPNSRGLHGTRSVATANPDQNVRGGCIHLQVDSLRQALNYFTVVGGDRKGPIGEGSDPW